MRICSLVPSATETLYALGLGDSVVGVTHDCDFPPEVRRKPILIKPRVDVHAPQGEIDHQVSELVSRGESIYAVDADLLRSISPDLIVTQDLCQVCAASPDDLATALTRFPVPPPVLALTPTSLADVWGDVRRIGEATGCPEIAASLAAELERRVASVVATIALSSQDAAPRPRVLCLEWLDPYYVGGHWVPEMVALAGGIDVFGRPGEASFRVTPEEVAACNADIIIVMLCGYNRERNQEELRRYLLPAAWNHLPAVRSGRIFAADANSHFSRPGPRLAEGVEALAHVLHPELFPVAPVPNAPAHV
jgi:iron complex transport system substrate-binding protein